MIKRRGKMVYILFWRLKKKLNFNICTRNISMSNGKLYVAFSFLFFIFCHSKRIKTDLIWKNFFGQNVQLINIYYNLRLFSKTFLYEINFTSDILLNLIFVCRKQLWKKVLETDKKENPFSVYICLLKCNSMTKYKLLFCALRI